MTHRAETVMVQFVAAVTGLTTTGANVFRDRVYDIESSKAAALSVLMGPDDPLPDDQQSHPYLDSWLSIDVDIYVKQASSVAVTTTLNKIRAEITAAVMADYTLGQTFIVDYEEGGADAPEIGIGEQPVARQRIGWRFLYRRLNTNAEAS